MPLHLTGTDFQMEAWAELQRIPYGQTESYRDEALHTGHPRSFRAVAQANHVNPICIIVPCHRVIAADGTLGGYGAGTDKKQWLLDHEASSTRS